MAFSVETIQEMPRRALQDACKKNSIKANSSSAVLRAALIEHLGLTSAEEAEAAAPTEEAAAPVEEAASPVEEAAAVAPMEETVEEAAAPAEETPQKPRKSILGEISTPGNRNTNMLDDGLQQMTDAMEALKMDRTVLAGVPSPKGVKTLFNGTAPAKFTEYSSRSSEYMFGAKSF